MPDFLPAAEGPLLSWARSFLAKVAVDPQRFLLSQQQIDQFSQIVDRYAECYARADSRQTNSTVAVAEKRDSKRELKRMAREIARIVRAVPGLLPAERVDLGLGVPDQTPTLGAAPEEAPDVSLSSPSEGLLTVRLSTPNSKRRRRPRGTCGAMVFLHTGEAPPETSREWGPPTLTTTQELTVELSPSTPRGSRVWVTACWLGPRLQRGPFARTMSLNVAGGSVAVPGMQRQAA